MKNNPSDPVVEVPEVPEVPEVSEEKGEKVEKVEDAPKLGLLAQVRAATQDKGKLFADNAALNTRAVQAEADLVTAQQSVASLTAENVKLKGEQAELAKHFDELEAEQKTVGEKATVMMAEVGVPAEDLPGQEGGEIESFESRYAAAQKAGPTSLKVFMKENRGEVKTFLASNR